MGSQLNTSPVCRDSSTSNVRKDIKQRDRPSFRQASHSHLDSEFDSFARIYKITL